MSATPRPAVERVHPPDAVIRLVNPAMRAILASPLHRVVSVERAPTRAELEDAIRESGLSIVFFEPR